MKQIIIADDDPGIREVFEIILNRAGYEVKMYPNGEALLNNEFVPPDLFIIDKQLSGVNGLEVCRYLKEYNLTKNIPVLMTSASPYVAAFATEAGADGFIEKPFKIKTVIELIEKYLKNSVLNNIN